MQWYVILQPRDPGGEARHQPGPSLAPDEGDADDLYHDHYN